MKSNNYKLRELKWFYSRDIDKPVLDPDFLLAVKVSCHDILKVWHSRFLLLKVFTVVMVLGSVTLFLTGFKMLSMIGGFLSMVLAISAFYYRNRFRNNPSETSIPSAIAIAQAVQQQAMEEFQKQTMDSPEAE